MNSPHEINQHKYLFAEKIEEIEDLVLRLVISAGIVSDETFISPSGIEGGHSITPGPIRFEIIFENYVAYLVLNESYDVPYPGLETERWEGKNFRVSNKTAFTDFMENNGVPKDWAGSYKHYKIYCQDQIINVVTVNDPTIKQLAQV